MRFSYIAVMLIALSGCAAKQNFTAQIPLSLQAFVDICLENSPSFARSASRAAKYQVTEFNDFGSSLSGATSDNTLGVHIKRHRECVITTESQPNKQLTAQFMNVVSETLGTETANKLPFTAQIKGSAYIFLHDRKGGESFIMLKRS